MKRLIPILAVLLAARSAHAYIEAFHPLGRICKESTSIVLVEVERVSTDKNLIVYRKIKDLKGTHKAEIKHNIGQRGSQPREWQTVMAWAKVGKRAVFFHNGNASLTAIDNYWYQCFKEGEWWAMSHAEPFVLRSYYGPADRLIAALDDILAGKEAVVPAMADAPKEKLQLREGKIHRIRASLKLQDFNAKRDVVAQGDDPKAVAISSPKPAPAVSTPRPVKPAPLYRRAININGPALTIDGQQWEAGNARDLVIVGARFENQSVKLVPSTDSARAKMIRSCIYGGGCSLTLRNVPNGRYDVYLHIWEDNDAQRFDLLLNGQRVVERYNSGKAGQWARLGPWTTAVTNGTIAILNSSSGHANLSGLEVIASGERPVITAGPEKLPPEVIVDKAARRISFPCAIAPRKLAHLNDVYPLEVIATYPSPEGQKAHETVVTFKGVKPSQIHAALESLGLKPGRPARGEGTKASGPELRIRLEIPDKAGKPRRIPIEQVMVDRKGNKPLPALTWHFTGSNLRQIDPESDQKTYGADATGTLIAIFPVTDDTVIQSNLTSKDEAAIKLEVAPNMLPKEGTALRLIIDAK